MTQTEKAFLITMLTRRPIPYYDRYEGNDMKKAKSRLIKSGHLKAGRIKSSPRFGRNTLKLTEKGVKVAIRALNSFSQTPRRQKCGPDKGKALPIRTDMYGKFNP
jgi:hypothetical protein